jgi:dTDP-L-rhamnose 4-epimerase
MRVLVTGGAGFIGSAVCAELTAQGHDMISYDRAVDPVDDIGDLRRVRAAVQGCDVIIHLAAKVGLGVDLDDLDDYVRQNDLGTAVVLRAAAAVGVRRLVYASSMVIYGEGRYRCDQHGPVPVPPRNRNDLDRLIFEPACGGCGRQLTPELVPEDTAADPRNVYAATKAHGEQLLRIWCREKGGRAAALRFHNVYGPGMPRDTPYAGVAALFRSSLEHGEPPQVFEDGRQRRNFVYVSDVARAVVAACTADLPPGMTPLNIGSPTVTTIGAMAAALSRALDGPEPVVTGRYRLGDVRHITADCSAAEAALGWRASVGLDEGIRRLLTDDRSRERSDTSING